jgi:hypothetical protein
VAFCRRPIYRSKTGSPNLPLQLRAVYTRPDVNAPSAKSGLLASPAIYTISFDVIGNAGRYTREMQHFGTTVGEVTVLRGENRVSFYENGSGDDLFFLTVFTGVRLDDGGHRQ